MRRIALVLIVFGLILTAGLATGAVVGRAGRGGGRPPARAGPAAALESRPASGLAVRSRPDRPGPDRRGPPDRDRPGGRAGPDDEPGAGEYLTGDLNLLRARGIVQYRVADPVAFVAPRGDGRADAGPTDRVEPGARLCPARDRRRAAAGPRRGRREVEADLARSVDRLGLGLAILGVSLTDARPPAEVAPDFAAAQAVAERARPPAQRGEDLRGHDSPRRARPGPRPDRAGPAVPTAPSHWPGAAQAGSSPCWARPTAPAA